MTESEAITVARAYFKLDESVKAAAFKVTNTLNEGSNYYLIIFGEENASVAIATVDMKTEKIKNSATMAGNAPHLPINEERAIELTGSPKNSKVELVWKAGKLTKSPLYPVWRIHSSEKTVYINQSGVISEDY